MKKLLTTIAIFLSTGTMIWAQAAPLLNYQGVVRNASGTPLASHAISLRLTVHDGSAAGTDVYQETQTTTTNAFGLYNLAIGAGLVTIGAFDGINWSTGNKFLQVEVDTTGASSYINLGTSQLLSVPYALYADNSGSLNGTTNYLVQFTSANTGGNSALYQNGNSIGLGTTTPPADFSVSSADSVANYVSTTYSGSSTKFGVSRTEYNGTLDANGNVAVLGTTLTTGAGKTYGFGVEGDGAEGGVLGISQTSSKSYQSVGLQGASANDSISAGVFASSGSYSGTTVLNYGIYAQTDGTGAVDDYAGYFLGNVYVSGTLSKAGGSFKIDHPLDPDNKYLVHSFVESPDMMNIYNGNTTTDASGEAIVTLPDYFEALNKDFRYQLTVIGVFAQAIVAKEVAGNQFTIKTNQPNVKVSWQVTGVRQDAWANAHRIVPEVEKQAMYKGKYLNPVELGKSKSLQIGGNLKPADIKKHAADGAKRLGDDKKGN